MGHTGCILASTKLAPAPLQGNSISKWHAQVGRSGTVLYMLLHNLLYLQAASRAAASSLAYPQHE